MLSLTKIDFGSKVDTQAVILELPDRWSLPLTHHTHNFVLKHQSSNSSVERANFDLKETVSTLRRPSMPLPTRYPFLDRIRMDIIEMRSVEGNQRVLVMVDNFTRMVACIPLEAGVVEQEHVRTHTLY